MTIEPPPRSCHQRLRPPRHRRQRVARDVEREQEVVARRVDVAALQVVRLGEGDGVHHQVEAAEARGHVGEGAIEVGVVAHVAGHHHVGFHGLRELPHVLLQPLALVREGELRACRVERLRDRPRDGTAVGDAGDERELSLDHAESLRDADRRRLVDRPSAFAARRALATHHRTRTESQRARGAARPTRNLRKATMRPCEGSWRARPSWSAPCCCLPRRGRVRSRT